MIEAMWSAKKSRKIIERIVVECDLVLQSPTHFGCGKGDDVIDMTLLTDARENKPLLPGTTIAGALREYLRSLETGYRKPMPDSEQDPAFKLEQDLMVNKLFGGFKGDDAGIQSAVILDDALGLMGNLEKTVIETRTGVIINAQSRTAEEKGLYDFQTWTAGTVFPLRLELQLLEHDDKEKMITALIMALTGLDNGMIRFGLRKHRGFGQIKAQHWRMKQFNLSRPTEFLDYLVHGASPLQDQNVKAADSIQAAFGRKLADSQTKLDSLEIRATFKLEGAIMIRTSAGLDADDPDGMQLKLVQTDGNLHPVIPGSSLAGALRQRALKIVKTIQPDDTAIGCALIEKLFGNNPKSADGRASKLQVDDTVIQNGREDRVQTRIRVDRFTGGAFETNLFSDMPVFARPDTEVNLSFRVFAPEPGECGLILLLLKDLWTGDLPLGGNSNIGRGRLIGVKANLTEIKSGIETVWGLNSGEPDTGMIMTDNTASLEEYVQAFVNLFGKETA